MRATAALAALTVASASFAGFKILPVYDPSITNDPNASAIIKCIQSMFDLYEWSFTDNVTVKLYVSKGGGLGSSAWGYYWNDAWVGINALYGDVTSSDDVEAVSHLGNNFFGSLAFNSANGRAVGFGTGGFMSFGGDGGFDGGIFLNTDICFYDHNHPEAGKFDLFSVAAHELDEVLGTPSGSGDWLAFVADLFRYDQNGNRHFSGDTSYHTYFSLDGVNRIVEYNHYGRTGGDWGDWAPHSPSMTQDWAIGSGIRIHPGEPEFRLLDAIGYDRSLTKPESYSLFRGILGSGNLASLFTVDNNPLVVRPGFIPFQSDYPVQILLQTTSRFTTPGRMRLRLTSRCPIPNIGQTIELFDYSTQAYTQVDFRAATLSYSNIEVVLSNPARFVDPGSRQVKVRLKYKGIQAIQAGAWSAIIDQAVLDITP